MCTKNANCSSVCKLKLCLPVAFGALAHALFLTGIVQHPKHHSRKACSSMTVDLQITAWLLRPSPHIAFCLPRKPKLQARTLSVVLLPSQAHVACALHLFKHPAAMCLISANVGCARCVESQLQSNPEPPV